MSDAEEPTKSCPLCGETIKSVAIRCKHCHAALTNYVKAGTVADFDRGEKSGPMPDADFERAFLDFAYETHEVITAISVAHALKVPISFADDRLEALAAGDTILRDVDDEGGIFFTLPGRRRRQLVPLAAQNIPHMAQTPSLVPLMESGDHFMIPASPPPTEAAAVTGLVLNLCIPGVGSIVAGKPGPGIAQLAMLVAGLPLCFVLVGFPIVFAAWLWALMTAAGALQEARRVNSAS